MVQLSHNSNTFEKRDFPIILVCDGVNGPANIGSLFRIAEAFGVSEIVLGNAIVDLNSARMKRTSREAHTKVPHSVSEDLFATLLHLREGGYKLISLEISDDSSRLEDFKWNQKDKIALVLGNEANGISEEILKESDAVLHIELFGTNSSINVAQGTAIALYQLTKSRQ
ncbi:TrmH family RNA methyltransferase [Aureitalea sp. L0-47]|uniref:TrmH family RNA methyltransferase n=1 Tax=Aureitalea sp. L0-47 TaxID=2816962 RepID=UPI002237C3BF|nr:TrmH family RNA methyltransferase [Aureitalea sp. L0-47]MCW5519342.1 TrmH family RNA methyltransferase [Aureitalea sp. L0-47]